MPDNIGPLPPLPRLLNEDLKTRVFTHKSVAGMRKSIHQTEDDDPQDNERCVLLAYTVLPADLKMNKG